MNFTLSRRLKVEEPTGMHSDEIRRLDHANGILIERLSVIVDDLIGMRPNNKNIRNRMAAELIWITYEHEKSLHDVKQSLTTCPHNKTPI